KQCITAWDLVRVRLVNHTNDIYARKRWTLPLKRLFSSAAGNEFSRILYVLLNSAGILGLLNPPAHLIKSFGFSVVSAPEINYEYQHILLSNHRIRQWE